MFRSIMRHVFLPLVLIFTVQTTFGSQAPDLSDAPDVVQKIAAEIRGKSSDDARAAIIERFGRAQRNVGSGIRIEQWDLPEGVLTFHPGTGPTFADRKTKKNFHLIQTKNTAGSNILSSYEMTTVPNPKNFGNTFWIGNLKFGPGAEYHFTDSGQNAGARGTQGQKFFLLHPAGTVEVRYVAPVTADTLLESLAEGATVAHLVFTSADKMDHATFSITSSERSRRLAFGAEKPLPFVMATGWKNFWR